MGGREGKYWMCVQRVRNRPLFLCVKLRNKGLLRVENNCKPLIGYMKGQNCQDREGRMCFSCVVPCLHLPVFIDC